MDPISIPASALTAHPLLAAAPTMLQLAAELAESRHADRHTAAEEMRQEWDAFVTSVKRDGILEPLQVVADGDGYLVIDGRHRLAAAEAAGLESVPCFVRPAEQTLAIIEGTLAGRRHWTKGMRAYFLVGLHPRVVSAKKGRPSKSEKCHSVAFSTAADLADANGLSRQLVDQAVDLYRAFHAPDHKPGSPEAIEAAALRERYEIAIWAGAGLGAVLAGIGGGETTVGKPRPASKFHSFDKPLSTLSRLGKQWLKWEPTEQTKAAQLLAAKAKELPPEFRTALIDALASADA